MIRTSFIIRANIKFSPKYDWEVNIELTLSYKLWK